MVGDGTSPSRSKAPLKRQTYRRIRSEPHVVLLAELASKMGFVERKLHENRGVFVEL